MSENLTVCLENGQPVVADHLLSAWHCLVHCVLLLLLLLLLMMMMMTMMLMVQSVTAMSEVQRHRSVMMTAVSVCVTRVSRDRDVTDVLLDSTASLSVCVRMSRCLTVSVSVSQSVCLSHSV